MFRVTRCLAGYLLIVVVATAEGQGAAGDGVVAKMYHPAGALPSFEVATVKKADPNAVGMPLKTENGWVSRNGQILKDYILNAYGVSPLSQMQVEGGPAWVGAERYVIQGKAPEELRVAMATMSDQGRTDEVRQMQQSLLAERFKLKVHFEVREMAVYDLEPAKGGLRLKEVAAPVMLPPGELPPPPPPPGPGGAAPAVRPGTMMMRMSPGVSILTAPGAEMGQLITMLRMSSDVGGKPIVDKSGFTGHFDIVEFKWANLTGGDAAASEDAPSLFTALEERFGLKLRAAKGMVEVLVVDKVERPSGN